MSNEQEYVDRVQALLVTSLEVAVPLWVQQLRQRPWSELQARASRAMQMIAEHGDNILYKARRPGETAAAFNALAEAVAILSFSPGGVKLFGQHWQNEYLASE